MKHTPAAHACSPFPARRSAFARRMGRETAVAVLVGAREILRNGDVSHAFRQDSDFHYLTGFDEPDAVAVIAPGLPAPYVLFVRPRDRAMETWHGPRAGVEGARRRHGAAASYPIGRLDEILPGLLASADRLFYRVGRDAAFDEKLIGMMNRLRTQGRAGIKAPSTLEDPTPLLAEMRLFKGPGELDLLRKAVALTREGHLAAMAATRAGRVEYEIQAELEGVFRAGGSPRVGYETIVGSGANATILHWIRNDRRMKDGDLVLIDAGTEFGYYTADITRTFPVGGRFSKEQRAVYDVVLAAQEAGIRKARPGVTFQAVHDASTEVLIEGCLRLGLLKGTVKQNLKSGAYREFYMHKTSHWLGMDVHDAGSYKDGEKWRKLQPGMVLTVEPGLYISPDCRRGAARWRGIGVRIEDDILVTKGGRENLSEAIPKSADEMETLSGRG